MINDDKVLSQAKALYDLGFAIHWVQPKSKKPIDKDWPTRVKDDWENLVKKYQSGFNVGVVLGKKSTIGAHYLAAIDLDIKSADRADLVEAENWVADKFGPLKLTTPHDFSGRGNGSSHYFFLVPETFKSGVIHKSEKTILTGKKDRNGNPLAASAWHVELYCESKYIMLPPSIHPETGKEYFWGFEPKKASDFPIWPMHMIPKTIGSSRGRPAGSEKVDLKYSEIIDLEVVLEDRGLKEATIEKLIQGTNKGEAIGDRSSVMLSICLDMLKNGFSDNEILNVLTNPDYVIGATGYDEHHTNSDSREVVIYWVYTYTLLKAKRIQSGALDFEKEVLVTDLLSDEQAEKQNAELKSMTSWENRLKVSKQLIPFASLFNTLLVLENALPSKCFRHDLLTGRDYIFGETPWTTKAQTQLSDILIIQIKAWISTHYRFEPATGLVLEAVQMLSNKNAFHPIQDYLRSLDSWDGKNRLDFWLENHFEAKGPKEYLAQVFRKWVLAAVYRVMEPGYKFDWMIIFEGAQGVGKSSFGQILFGEEYFTNRIGHLEDKDAVLNIRAKWCAEFAELKDISKHDVELIKGFLSTKCDTLRLPYGRVPIDIPRQCIFFGTTNDDSYLKDDTGNRRFNPIEVGQLDFKALKRDREQLLAEALFIYDNGLEKHLELTGEAKRYAIRTRLDKMVGDDSSLMREQIQDFIEAELKKPEAERFNFSKFRIKHLWGMGPLANWKENFWHYRLAAKALRSLGSEERIVNGYPHWAFNTEK